MNDDDEKTSKRVSVLIVNWNTCDLLRSCLSSLGVTDEADQLEIVVVDNGSNDGSAAMVADEFPTVTVVANDDNAGFGRANNQGFEASTAPYVLLLNSDTEVPSGAIAHCRDHLAADGDVGVVGCRIANPDGTTQNSIFRFPSLRAVVSKNLWLAQAAPKNPTLNYERYGEVEPTETTAVDVVMGSFFMVRRADVDGELFDDDYFMYTEEADLCRRMHGKDKRVEFVPDVSVMHVRSASSSTPRLRAWSDEAKKRSQLRYLWKWHGPVVAYLANIVMLVGLLPRTAAWAVGDLLAVVRQRPPGRLHKARAWPFHLASLFAPSLMRRRMQPPPLPGVTPPAAGPLTAVACTVVAASLLLWNMPIPGVRGAYREATEPAYDLARLDQDWSMFAPEVSQTSLFFHLEVVDEDGSVTMLEFPDGEPIIGTYRAYRWSAYEEALYEEDDLQDFAVDWALQQVADPSSVRRIDLVARESDASVGDHGPFEPTYNRIVFYTYEPES